MSVTLRTSQDCRESLKDGFTAQLEPLRPGLRAYCRSLTRSSWEGEDLLQDTSLKAYTQYLRDPGRQDLSRTYLYRIALRTWIDRCRQSRIPVDPLDGLEHRLTAHAADPDDVRAAMELLVTQLPARQRVLFLLVDVMRFTASEAADLIGCTEGAVKAALHRARAKLREGGDERFYGNELSKEIGRVASEQIVYAYLEAFEQHNPEALVRLLNEAGTADNLRAVARRTSAAASPLHGIASSPPSGANAPSCLAAAA